MGCMKHRRALFALIAMISLASSSGLAQNDKKMSDQQKKEIQNIVKIVDDLAAGQNAPNDLSLAWVREDFLKAQGNKQYVPFTVSIDASKLAPNATAVALYWRVVAKERRQERQRQEEGLRVRRYHLRADYGADPSAGYDNGDNYNDW
ncbi:MAG: hypothetical protein DMG03_12045 [Acidobacteria bacterium]|nr:MAG: hypothetical protein DMG03_12045 [Acidobacteriota bacterium]